MSSHSFVARMPDRPGSMERAAEIIKRHGGNIERIHYDRRIDTQTVFFEVTCDEVALKAIRRELEAIGYLQSSLAPLSLLKLNVHVANRPGALYEFLDRTTAAGANIAFLDFDHRSDDPDRLTVSLTIEQGANVEGLLDDLRSKFRLEVLEYDRTGRNLDDAVFYIRFAQELREIIGDAEDEFLMKLLHDVDHIVQSLTNLGKDPKKAFESILLTGRMLKSTLGEGFHASVQTIDLDWRRQLFCFQMPCGGNVFVFRDGDEAVLFDTGYGIYHEDIVRMLRSYDLDADCITRVFLTHADADHAGGAGFFRCPSHMHPFTLRILGDLSRAYGSKSEGSVLEEVYTRLINLFSRYNPPTEPVLFPAAGEGKIGPFPWLGEFRVGGVRFNVLESLGGHQAGQVFFLSEDARLLFTGDSLFNLDSLSEDRARYNLLARDLMTSVNVDSEAAKKERGGLLDLAASLEVLGKGVLVCGGHGAVSKPNGDRLEVASQVEEYWPGRMD
ncbi:MAG: MBL fold metallo-hydrolase [Methanomassiliicoccales archaeon]|nr:MBL fold metallo-hydrolase [Methanomassiliicoccales archaeon]